MRIVLLTHPSFLPSQSMPRFAGMLKKAFENRGHSVEIWSPQPRVFNWVPRGRLSKWAGYVDQYLTFPVSLRRRLRNAPRDTLFVFCDQALGPWVPLVNEFHHAIHVHDLLALRSALGDVPENPTSLSGRIYQRYIRRGFKRGRHFISVSNKTRSDLHRFGEVDALTSEVVYNGLNFDYRPLPPADSLLILRSAKLPPVPAGLLLHVGGGQWYKNLEGVIAIYAKYAAGTPDPLPLWCVSPQPSASVRAQLAAVPASGRVIFVKGVAGAELQALYALSKALLFPSLAEGFGWPLIEAQACGCPVITTNDPPMNEVGGPAAEYLPRLMPGADIDAWSDQGSEVLRKLLSEGDTARLQRRERGIAWALSFNAEAAVDQYLAIYQRILTERVDTLIAEDTRSTCD